MEKGDMRKLTLATVLLLAAAATGALAQTATPPPQTFGTTIYFDWTQYLTKDGVRTTTAGPGFKNNFFAFRRAYFTYENKIGDNLKFRFRYDADNTANLTSVDVKTGAAKKDDKLRPFIKHIYLDYAGLLPNSSLKIGVTETLTFKPAEERWGYRSVAKTLMDGYKDVTGVEIDATSADLGASLTGSFNKYLRYGVMVSNGSHYSHAENDKWKKLMAQATLVPLAGFSLVGYMDYEKQSADAEALTWKGDAFLETVKNLVLGAEFFVYRNDLLQTAAKERYDVSGWSVFGRYAISPDKLSVFARFDAYEPNSKAADDGTSLVIAGVDWTPIHKSWKLQPNVWYYTHQSDLKKDDLIFNLTFFLSF
jgi:hypothetical protein